MIPAIKIAPRQFDSVAEAVTCLQDEEPRWQLASPTALRLEPDGHLSIGSDRCPLTEVAVETLREFLWIPKAFFDDVCDAELAADIVNHLLARVSAQAERLRLRLTGDNVVRSILPASVFPVSSVELLSRCQGLDGELPNGVLLTDRLLRVSAVHAAKHVEGAAIGDIVRTGWDLTNSDDALAPLEVRAFAYRLHCRNGAVFGKRLGGLTRSPRARTPSVHEALAVAYQSVRDLSNERKMAGAMQKSREVELGDVAPMVLHRLRRTVPKETCAHRFAENILPTSAFYDAANRITQYARSLPMKRRRYFEKLGASLMEVFVDAGTPEMSAPLLSQLQDLWNAIRN